MSNQGKPEYDGDYVQSLARGLAVIKSFNKAARGQTLSEVASNAELTRASARRALHTLRALGYASNEGRMFYLTSRILDLGFSYLSSMPITDIAGPFVEELVDVVHESSSIAVLDDYEIVYILRVHTHKIMSANIAVGSRLPAFWTSMGRVLLSALSENELENKIKTLVVKKYTKYTVTDIDHIYQIIDQVRKQNWCIVDQELEYGLVSVAAPVKNRSKITIGAINVSCHAGEGATRNIKKNILPKLTDTATKISAALN